MSSPSCAPSARGAQRWPRPAAPSAPRYIGVGFGVATGVGIVTVADLNDLQLIRLGIELDAGGPVLRCGDHEREAARTRDGGLATSEEAHLREVVNGLSLPHEPRAAAAVDADLDVALRG